MKSNKIVSFVAAAVVPLVNILLVLSPHQVFAQQHIPTDTPIPTTQVIPTPAPNHGPTEAPILVDDPKMPSEVSVVIVSVVACVSFIVVTMVVICYFCRRARPDSINAGMAAGVVLDNVMPRGFSSLHREAVVAIAIDDVDFDAAGESSRQGSPRTPVIGYLIAPNPSWALERANTSSRQTNSNNNDSTDPSSSTTRNIPRSPPHLPGFVPYTSSV